MTLAAFALLMTGVLLNAGAQLLLKAGTNVLGVLTLTRDTWADTLTKMATQGHFVLGATCYLLSLFVWILGLSRVPVSVAYPLLSVGYVVNAIAAHFLFGDDQMNALARMRLLSALVLAPLAAAWCIARAFAARARVEGDVLVLFNHEPPTEIPVRNIVAVEPWTLALPATGVWLRMDSGRRWSRGIGLDDPAALVDALTRAGGRPGLASRMAGGLSGLVSAYARTRLAVPRHRMLDHPVLKFVLFPLVPALPAFRLHQHIAFGGTFGEYLTYGLQAYLTAFGIWWASWVIGLVIFAAALRAVIEIVTGVSLALRRESAIEIRRWFELLGRLLFYVGVPAWLLIRFLPW